MKILVTGGAGFIGSNLVHYLLGSSNHELYSEIDVVVTLDKLTYAGSQTRLAGLETDHRHVFVEGDIGDSALVSALLREHQIDAVMHLAAESHVDRSIDNPEQFIQTNIVGTYRLLEEIRRFWGDRSCSIRHPRFLHVSTDEVFGSLGVNDAAFSETSPYAPNSPYSASKAASDHLVRSYHHTYGVPAITTHCSNNFGPYQFSEKLVPLMIRKLLSDNRLPVYGEGANIRDWIYVEDHCRGLVKVLVRGIPGTNYVIGGRCEMTNLKMVRAIIEIFRELAPNRCKQSEEELIMYVKDRPGHDLRYAVNPERIERELGWAPREDIMSGLRRTVQWYLDHEEWIFDTSEGNYHGERLGNPS
jgi:dTDP-glucose 4,6-dehydratase